MVTPIDHDLKREIILFCGAYEYNHLKQKEPLSRDYITYYRSLLNSWCELRPIDIKRCYEYWKDKYHEQMEYNIQYVQKLMKENEGK